MHHVLTCYKRSRRSVRGYISHFWSIFNSNNPTIIIRNILLAFSTHHSYLQGYNATYYGHHPTPNAMAVCGWPSTQFLCCQKLVFPSNILSPATNMKKYWLLCLYWPLYTAFFLAMIKYMITLRQLPRLEGKTIEFQSGSGYCWFYAVRHLQWNGLVLKVCPSYI